MLRGHIIRGNAPPPTQCVVTLARRSGVAYDDVPLVAAYPVIVVRWAEAAAAERMGRKGLWARLLRTAKGRGTAAQANTTRADSYRLRRCVPPSRVRGCESNPSLKTRLLAAG